MSLQKKLLKVLDAMNRIPKNGRNNFQKYDYVMESDLMDHIRPLMVENGITFSFSVEEIDIKEVDNGLIAYAKCKFILFDADKPEEKMEAYVWGSGYDKQDKALYKAYTGATKYFLMKTFMTSTGDDPETDERKTPQTKTVETVERKKVSQLDETTKKKIQEPLMKMINDLAELTESSVETVIKEGLSGKNIGDLYRDEAVLVYKALAAKIKKIKK